MVRIVDCPFCLGRLGYVVSTCEDCCGSGEITEAVKKQHRRVRNGTTEAHGRTWPMYEHTAFETEILGYVEPDAVESFKAELLALCDRYGVVPKVRPVPVIGMSPEDQAEKEELDRIALAA